MRRERWLRLLACFLAAAVLAACGGGKGSGAPGAAPGGGAGNLSVQAFGQGGWQVNVAGKGWYFDWLPGDRLVVQAGLGSGSVVEVDPARGETHAWPAAPAHMLTAVSPDAKHIAWPEQQGKGYRLMVAEPGGSGQPVGQGSEDIYQIYWLDAATLLVERPSRVQIIPLGGGQPADYPGRRIVQVAGTAAVLSDPRFPGPGLVVTATGVSRPLPSGTLFALLNADGTRLAWAPSLPPPAQPTAWLQPRRAEAHGSAAAYAREVRLVEVASGKEVAVALPDAVFLDNAAWQKGGGDLVLATHTTNDKDGFPKGGGLLRLAAGGRLQRLAPGADYFELGGFIGDRIAVFLGDPQDYSNMKAFLLDAAGGRRPLETAPVQIIDDPVAPPVLVYGTEKAIVLIDRASGRREVLPRADLPKGTEIYPPQLSPDGRWVVLRGEGRLLLLPAARYAAAPL